MSRSMKDDDSGMNVILEYILTFAIVIILFGVLLFTFNAIMVQSKSVIMYDDFKIISNDVASRIVIFDRLMSGASAQGGSIDSLNISFDVPPTIGDKTYNINITDKYVEVFAPGEQTALARASFQTTYAVRPSFISSSWGHYIITYNKTANAMEVTYGERKPE